MTTNKCLLCHGAVRYREAECVRERIEMQDRIQTTIRLPCALMEQLRREAACSKGRKDDAAVMAAPEN